MLENCLNILETELVTLCQMLNDQLDPRGKRFVYLEDTDIVFIKTLSICNIGCSVDLRVQCTLNSKVMNLLFMLFFIVELYNPLLMNLFSYLFFRQI